MRIQTRHLLTAAMLLAVDVAALIMWTPSFPLLLTHLQAPRDWVSSAGADGAALEFAAVALWCWGIWVGVGLVFAVVSTVPGRVGALGSAAARRSLPAAMRRLVIGSVGVGLAITPLLAPSMAGATPRTPAPVTALEIGWPTDQGVTPPVSIPWPSTSVTPTSTASPPTTPPHTTPTNSPPASATAAPVDSREAVTVHAGDCLWMIAAHRLGPRATDDQIATAWPQWYRANVGAIGSDPNLIKAGQRLVPPASKGSPS